MKIELDTNNITEQDLVILRILTGGEAPTTQAPASKPAPAAKPAPKAKPEPVAAPEPVEVPTSEEAGDTGDEELIAPTDSADPAPDGPVLGDAVAAATKLVSGGGSKKVKEALAEIGVKRVSELAPDQIQAFLDALEA